VRNYNLIPRMCRPPPRLAPSLRPKDRLIRDFNTIPIMLMAHRYQLSRKLPIAGCFRHPVQAGAGGEHDGNAVDDDASNLECF